MSLLIDRLAMTDEERERWMVAPCARRLKRPLCVFCGRRIIRDGWLHPKVGANYAHYQCTPGLGWAHKP